MSLVASACSGGGKGASDTTTRNTAVAAPSGRAARTSGPFTVALSAGHPAAAIANAVSFVRGKSLDQGAIDAVLRGLSPFTHTDGAVPFKRPPESIPRPRAGATITRPFGGAPAPAPKPTNDGPLRVLRYQPVGDVNIAPDLSVTFNQPMVPLGTLAQLAHAAIPLKVTPALKGRWRWIGTRTLRFEFTGAVDRLPMATSYTVTIPAGTKSQTGHTLKDAVQWTFRTPAPNVLNFAPEKTTVDTAQVFIATFDQRIDPAAVIRTITLTADGKKVAIRKATATEIAADERVRQIADDAQTGRWVAFRPVASMANGAALSISIGPRTPSAEGPRTTEKPSVHTAVTYSALKVTDTNCGYGQGCRPGSGFSVTFNNALDPKAFRPSAVKLEPAVPGASIGVSGNTLTMNGATKRNTAYKVTLPATLRDEFGQTLGAAHTETIRVGDFTPQLDGFTRRLITTDPFATRPTVSVTSVGHTTLKVDVYAVDASKWTEYQDFQQRWGDIGQARPPWPRRSTTTITVDGGGHDLTETTIDLSADLRGATGHLVVIVSPTRTFAKNTEEYWQNRPTIAWVQVTSIGVDAAASTDTLVAWATNLRDGHPIEGVHVKLGGIASTATTDRDGVARLRLERARYLTATKGDDVAILPADSEYEWRPTTLSDSVTGFAFDDRGVYRPGEAVHIKGWFRRVHASSEMSVTPLDKARTATWTARDAFGHELGKGELTLNAVSGFDVKIDVAQGSALGRAQFEISVDDGGIRGATSVGFQIEEFRRPEFEVVTRAESAGPHLLTGPVTVAALSQYFSGGALANAPVVWQVTTSTGTYAPPNWPQFSFGESTPYWMQDLRGGPFAIASDVAIRGGFTRDTCCLPPTKEKAVTYTGRTDATGTHYLQLNFDGEKPDLPVTVSANAAVTDVNRQSFASNLELLVHPSTLYVGLRSTRQFVRQGEPLDIEAIVTNIDGDAVAGRRFTITASRVEQVFENGAWVEHDVDPKHCAVTSAAKPESCSINAGIGGQYKISAVVVDDAGGHNRSEFTRWVSGTDTIPTREVQQDTATIVPDKDLYRPGDTAELLIVAPSAKADGLLTISANGKNHTQHFTLAGGAAVVKVPITTAYPRGLTVQADIAGQAPRLRDDGEADPHLPARPAFAAGTLALHVAPADRTLKITAVARDRVTEPGAHDTVDVSVKAANGAPVAGADVAVVVVDDAVLSLTGYQLADPIGAMYPAQSEQGSVDYLRSSLLLANPTVFGQATAGTPTTLRSVSGIKSSERFAASNGAQSADQAQALYHATAQSTTTAEGVKVRTNFDALALFSPTLRTDAAGRAHASFDLPDNLTRYRVMAVVADHGDRFGAGESTITARIPLQIRPSAPRFANFGDHFEFPVVVQNQTDKPFTADVVLETSNLSLTGPKGKRVTVPANNRVEVHFGAKTDSAGTARYRVSASDGDHRDSAVGEFPVYTPVTTEAFATYGVVDKGAIAQPLQTPTGVIPQFGGLEIDTSSTAMQALTDAVVYMNEYPYDSADAYASRIIALTSLRDVFAAFGGVGVPTAAQVDTRIKADVKALVALQRDDGGFSTWTRQGDPQPYISVQATEALVLARLAGFAVAETAHSRALAYIRNIEAHFTRDWDAQARHAVSAYALYVRGRAGDRDAAKAEALYRSDAHLALDALAWLWPVVNDPAIDHAIATTIANRAHDTPGAVTFSAAYDDGTHLVLASDRRTDGIVLDALITKLPHSDLIPKVVAGLIGNQVKGRWDNIQENGFILVALQRYFAAFEAQTPSFVARAWLGNTYAAEHTYQGRSIDRQHTLVPMNMLGGNPNIVLDKAGTGRLYYRLGLRYAPSDLSLGALDEGFVVDRVYEAVNDKGDVRRDDNGVWHIKPGAMVRVRITMVADSNHTNMALVDPLPAGLEAVNPTLAASPRAPAATPPSGASAKLPQWFGSTWFDHENLRDDRAEAFGSYLYGGTYDYTYVARATTLGEFVVPPARAEEIYAPEVFGRSASARVIVG